MKNIFFLIGLSFSLVYAQFTLMPEVLLQTESYLQKNRGNDTTDFVYEILGKNKLPMNIDAPVEEYNGRYVIQMNSNTRTEKLQDERMLQMIAMKDLKKILSDSIFSSTRITRIGFEHQQKNDVIEIVGGIVMVHQLIQDFPIRGDSFIFLYYDAFSNLRKIEYSWLHIKKSAVKKIDYSLKEFQLHKEKLEKKVAEISDELAKENMRGELYKAVQSWRMITDSIGKNVLVPSITYLGSFEDNGVKRYISFDIDKFSTTLSRFEICSKK